MDGERTEIVMVEDRLDLIAERCLGSPDLWRLLAEVNDIEDPTQVPPGTELRIPVPYGRGGLG
jgi:nucleoid-associated protein YgaU